MNKKLKKILMEYKIDYEKLMMPLIIISKLDNFDVFEIKRDCSLQEYVDYLDYIDKNDIGYLITNSLLFDGNIFHIKKKTIYIYQSDNKTYNFYSNDKNIFIEERILYKEDDNTTEDLIIRLNRTSKKYSLSQMKHDKNHSTFLVKSYSSYKENKGSLALDEGEAKIIMHKLINAIQEIPNLDKIIDLDEVKVLDQDSDLQIKRIVL